jgi:hypothetical protein
MSRSSVAASLEASLQEQVVTKSLPSGLAPPPGLDREDPPPTSPAEVQPAKTEELPQKTPAPASDDRAKCQTSEYHILLQNLPKRLMQAEVIKRMVKEAGLKDIKKLAFRPDGRALITLGTHEAVCQCVSLFNGLPWFDAPVCNIPRIQATWVVSAPAEKQSVHRATAPAAMTSKSTLSAEASTFIPGACGWTSEARPPQSVSFKDASEKLHELDRLSHMSTDGGLSSDDASCGSDSELEMQLVRA